MFVTFPVFYLYNLAQFQKREKIPVFPPVFETDADDRQFKQCILT